MRSLYISRVKIKNYRNFKNVDVSLGHKQVIIGENNVGKTNFLRALQLVLDPTLSDEDRMLEESDFNDSIENPFDNQEEIQIDIYISGYENNKAILAVLQDATVLNAIGEEELLITYKYAPYTDSSGNISYQYSIFMANDESRRFTANERKYLNLKVIKALRDVENDMRNSKTSPIKKMLKEYAIDKLKLEQIADIYREGGEKVLELDELKDLTNNINKRFSKVLGNHDFDVSLQAMEIDPNRVLASLKLLMANRSTTESSLGINNILYISLIMQMLQDKTVPTFLKKELYDELCLKEDSKIVEEVYEVNSSGNYFLKEILSDAQRYDIHSFMDKYCSKNIGVTILAIEEPEAHLHPVNQRLIYRDVINNSNNSVLLTTHSTHITAIAPIESIVNLHVKLDEGTVIHATADMPMTDGEFLDVERYLDVKRGEIYLGKGVILVEGIAEEYIIPRFAEIMEKPLDEMGIIVCNINCTNFKPYVKLLRSLDIPYAVITDGDFYYLNDNEERVYHVLEDEIAADIECGYLGMEVIGRLVTEVGLLNESDIPENRSDTDKLYHTYGIFVGNNTFEVDMMKACASDTTAIQIFIDIFNELTDGGDRQKENFKNEINDKKYWKCLSKIEGNGIGKGRFAQKLSGRVCKAHIPDYIRKAIDYIYKKVNI
ncbi:MAG: AAA family ATPase [Acetatifactor sp.]|nr:AAA family ATPase [Acetatifactor sp.]